MPLITKTFTAVQYNGNNLQEIQQAFNLTDEDIWQIDASKGIETLPFEAFEPWEKEAKGYPTNVLFFKKFYYIFPTDWLIKEDKRLYTCTNKKYQKWIS